jgi:hypothetical protein
MVGPLLAHFEPKNCGHSPYRNWKGLAGFFWVSRCMQRWLVMLISVCIMFRLSRLGLFQVAGVQGKVRDPVLPRGPDGRLTPI